MKVVAFAASKGGAGKTTLATSLAVRAANDKPRVALVDLDTQQSLRGWHERRGDGNCDNPKLFSGIDTLPEAVEMLAPDGWQWLIADTPPAGVERMQYNLSAANLVIIPVKTSAYDLEAIVPVVEVCLDGEIPYVCLLNDCDPRSTLTKSARKLLEDEGLSVAGFEVAHRVAYQASPTVGKSAAEVERDGKAAAEADQLWALVQSMTKGARNV